MADWITLNVGNFLTVDKMNAFNNNFDVIKNFFNQDLDFKDVSVTYNIDIGLILEKMNSVEDNIQNIENNVDWINPFFKDFEWVKNTLNKKQNIQRWASYLQYTYDVLTQKTKALQYLIDENGDYILDKYGNYILVLKE